MFPRTLGDLLLLPVNCGSQQRLVAVAREKNGYKVALRTLDGALTELRVIDDVADVKIRALVCRRLRFAFGKRRQTVIARPAIDLVVFFTEIVENKFAPAAAGFAVLQHHRKLALVVGLLRLVAREVERPFNMLLDRRRDAVRAFRDVVDEPPLLEKRRNDFNFFS